jgi:cation:H+ antiporter
MPDGVRMLDGSLTLALAVLVVGLVVLAVGSDQLVDGAARISDRLGVPPLVVGIVVIGAGTSAPELLIAVLSAVAGVYDLGVGNVVGSNLANVLLVLGVAALAHPVHVPRTTARREGPLSLLAVVAFAWAVQTPLRRGDALLLGGLLVVVLTLILTRGEEEVGTPTIDDEGDPADDSRDVSDRSVRREWWRVGLGLAATLAGAQAVVAGGAATADAAGLSDGFVGLTVVAVGTSLPELAAAVQAVRRGQTELLVGNVLGSNLFNALAVGPFAVWTGASLGAAVAPEVAGEATFLMLAAAIAVGLLLVRERIGRMAGAALVLGYVGAVALMAT